MELFEFSARRPRGGPVVLGLARERPEARVDVALRLVARQVHADVVAPRVGLRGLRVAYRLFIWKTCRLGRAREKMQIQQNLYY